MILNRRNFIQIGGLSLASAVAGFSFPVPNTNNGNLDTKPLAVNMPSADGNYTFFVDGQKQVINITDQLGKINIPQHSCTIEYTGEDGVSQISVYIDQHTSKSFLLPGRSTNEEVDLQWNTVLLGNPIRAGKIVASISGPTNTTPVVEVTDLQGRVLIKEKLTKTKVTEEYTFDVRQFSKGILLLKVSDNDFSQTLKVVHGN